MLDPFDSYFGPAAYTYSRERAIEDGFLVDVSDAARVHGFQGSVTATRAVYESCVAWGPEDAARQGVQSESDRLDSLLWLAAFALSNSTDGQAQMLFNCVVPRGMSREPEAVALRAVVEPDQFGAPAVTILKAEEI